MANALEGVAVEFTLTVTSLNNSSPLIVARTPDYHTVLSIGDSTPRAHDVFSFQVSARNVGGSSDATAITGKFPFQPPVLDYFHHFLVKDGDQVTLTVTLNVCNEIVSLH